MCACNTWGNLGINNNLYNNNTGVLGINDSSSCGCGNNTGNLGTNSSNCSACNDNGNLGTNNCPCSSCNSNSRNNTATLGASDRSLNDALANNIGRRCCCEFVVGNTLVKRSGILCQVGSNYIALASGNNNCNSCMFCSTCNLNFVRID